MLHTRSLALYAQTCHTVHADAAEGAAGLPALAWVPRTHKPGLCGLRRLHRLPHLGESLPRAGHDQLATSVGHGRRRGDGHQLGAPWVRHLGLHHLPDGDPGGHDRRLALAGLRELLAERLLLWALDGLGGNPGFYYGLLDAAPNAPQILVSSGIVLTSS